MIRDSIILCLLAVWYIWMMLEQMEHHREIVADKIESATIPCAPMILTDDPTRTDDNVCTKKI